MENTKSLKKRIFEIIQIGSRFDWQSVLFDVVITIAIIVNIAIIFLLTFDQALPYEGMLKGIEFVTIIIFTIEYILRVWTANYLYPDKRNISATLSFIFSFYGLIDLLSILPYFLPAFTLSGAVAFRMLRVIRILRLFQINAQYDAFNVITTVLKDKKNQILSSMTLILILMLASSLCMYHLEHEAQPENFANAFSGIWWTVSTVLTVGYGDIYPITIGGKVMAIIIAFLGVGVVAIPTGIISAGFVEYYTRIKSGMANHIEADFVTMDMVYEHPDIGKTVDELKLPEGLFVAVVLRDKKVLDPSGDLKLLQGDHLLIGTTSVMRLEEALEEIHLEPGHVWSGKRIEELDISRQDYIVRIKRKNKILQPTKKLTLQTGDCLWLYYKK